MSMSDNRGRWLSELRNIIIPVYLVIFFYYAYPILICLVICNRPIQPRMRNTMCNSLENLKLSDIISMAALALDCINYPTMHEKTYMNVAWFSHK